MTEWNTHTVRTVSSPQVRNLCHLQQHPLQINDHQGPKNRLKQGIHTLSMGVSDTNTAWTGTLSSMSMVLWHV